MSAAVGVSPAWLTRREKADAAARAVDLIGQLVLPSSRPVVVHDLGCGTGSMGRWLAPRLPGPQHWVLYDRDADLLARAAADRPRAAADGTAVTVETRQRDITRLDEQELAGASLVTASALLDVLTAGEVEHLVSSCVDAECPALLTLSVTGRVELDPADPLDDTIAVAFNAHQRRTAGGRRLLGPDAAGITAERFRRLGADVLVRPAPWRLTAADAELTAEWLTGWVGAAREQRPELADAARGYERRRSAAVAAGGLRVTVHHQDLLAVPPRPSGRR